MEKLSLVAQLGPSRCTQSLEGSVLVIKSVGVCYGQRSRSMLFWRGVVWCTLLLCCVCSNFSSLVIALAFVIAFFYSTKTCTLNSSAVLEWSVSVPRPPFWLQFPIALFNLLQAFQHFKFIAKFLKLHKKSGKPGECL